MSRYRKKQRYIAQRFEKEWNINRALAVPGRFPLTIVLDHLKADFNIGKILRSAEVFSMQQVFIIGTPFFDPLPSMGAFRVVPCRFFQDFGECYPSIDTGQPILAFDERGISIEKVEIPRETAFVFGHEEFGLQFRPEDYQRMVVVRIPRFGRIHSLNVSVAASIAMYEYIRRHALGGNEETSNF